MATYELSDPSGAVYHVDAPDTMAQADVLKYFQQNKPPAGNDMGRGAAVVQGYNAAIPFGEKIAAGLGAVGAKVYDKTIGDNVTEGQSIGDLYREARTDQDATAKAHTGYYVGGMALGAIPGLLVGGAAADASGLSKLNELTTVAKAAPEAGTLAKAGNLAARAGVGAVKGAGVGAVYGAGSAAPDEMGEGAIHGAKVGAILGAALPVAGAAYDGIKGKLADRADKFLLDLTTPRAVGNVRKGIAENMTEEGLLNTATQNATPHQRQVMDTISQLGVKRGNSDLANREIIEGALGTEAEQLRSNIAGSKAIYNTQDLNSRITKFADDALTDNPLLVEDSAGTNYLKMATNKMLGLAKANGGTPEGLLNTRQQFDQWAKSRGGFKDGGNAFREAVSVVRSAANDYLGEMVPTAAVRDSLTKQSHMYDAIDALNSKIAYMPGNRVSRFFDSTPGKIVKYGAGAAGADALYHNIANQLSSKTSGDDE